MHLYDKNGMPISITTMNKVYVNATEGKVVNFMRALSNTSIVGYLIKKLQIYGNWLSQV